MTIASEIKEIDAVMERLLDKLAQTVSSQTGQEGIDLRHQIGEVRARYVDMLVDGSFAAELLDCFTTAREINVKLTSLWHVHEALFAEQPVGGICKAIVQTAICFCLATESRMITAIRFVSSDDAKAMMQKMRRVFDTAKELAADLIDSSNYQKLTALGGALTRHLAVTALRLPQMITFNIGSNLPSLALSHRVYHDASRAEELAAENRIVHPAFCMSTMRGLST